MTESLHLKDCPVCQSALSITHDKLDDSVILRPENLPPLLKDKLQVVNTYKRVKGLDSSWQKAHGARAIVYAGTLLESVGVHGGQLERAVGLLEWLQSQGKDFDLGSAPSFFGAYLEAIRAMQRLSMCRCKVCGESFNSGRMMGTVKLDDCGRHA